MADDKPADKGANLTKPVREPDVIDRLACVLLDNRDRLLTLAQKHGNFTVHLAGDTARVELTDHIIV